MESKDYRKVFRGEMALLTLGSGDGNGRTNGPCMYFRRSIWFDSKGLEMTLNTPHGWVKMLLEIWGKDFASVILFDIFLSGFNTFT